MKKREQIVQDLEKNLENLNLKIDEVEKKFASLKGDMRQKFQGELEKMRSHRDKIRYDMSLLKSASESAYEEMEKGVRKAVDNLKSAVNSAKEKLGY